MQISHVVVHKINKTETQQVAQEYFANEELELSTDVQEFGKSLAKTYYDRKSRFYTIFKIEEEIEPQFKISLDKYLSNEINFYDFSKQVTIILKDEMNKQTLSRGGYLIIQDYISLNDRRYIFISLLNNKTNFSVNDDSMHVIKNLALNIEHMAMSSVINIQKYENSSQNYITFLKGLREIPDYFISFIGADKDRKRDIKEVTKNWVDVIEKFYIQERVEPDIIESRNNNLLHEVKNLHRREELITSDIIANIISPENPDIFVEFAYDEENDFSLPSEMEKLDTTTLNKLSIFTYTNRAKSFSIKFKRRDIGTILNIENDQIIIHDAEIISQISNELENGR